MTKTHTEKNTKENKGKVLSGIVRSVKMKDTAVIEVARYFKHAKYDKYINARKRYKIHDAGNTLTLGDRVEFIECRPISKDKRFRLLRVVTKAKAVDVTEDNK